MTQEQSGILAPVPALSRYLQFRLIDAPSARDALLRLTANTVGDSLVVGIGHPLAAALGAEIAGLRPFPCLAGKVAVPATPTELWCWLRGDDRGELLHRGRRL